MITKTPIKGLSKEDWLAERAGTIGGSEIGAVLGMNPWTSPYALWAEKTGRKPAFSGNLATRVGTFCEDLVAELFTEASGIKVKKTQFIWYNTNFPVLHASPDRFCVGLKAGLEIKTTSAYNGDKFHGEEFPAQYYAQAVQYMAVCDIPQWFIAVLIGNHDFRIYHLTRDKNIQRPDWCVSSLYVEDAEITTLNAAAEAFMAHVTHDIPPDIDGSESTEEALDEVFPAEQTETKVDLYGRESLFEEWAEITGQMKALDVRKTEIANIIKADLGEHERGICGDYEVSWKTRNVTRFDSKTALKENPSLAIYQKTSTSRVFTVK